MLAHYQVKVKGRLPADANLRFDGLTVTEENGDTVLSAAVADQSALYGVLSWLRDLNLVLLRVSRVEPNPAEG